jgi:hypothetical protein
MGHQIADRAGACPSRRAGTNTLFDRSPATANPDPEETTDQWPASSTRSARACPPPLREAAEAGQLLVHHKRRGSWACASVELSRRSTGAGRSRLVAA